MRDLISIALKRGMMLYEYKPTLEENGALSFDIFPVWEGTQIGIHESNGSL